MDDAGGLGNSHRSLCVAEISQIIGGYAYFLHLKILVLLHAAYKHLRAMFF